MVERRKMKDERWAVISMTLMWYASFIVERNRRRSRVSNATLNKK